MVVRRGSQEGFGIPGTMGVEAIPDQHDGARNVSVEIAQERTDLLGCDIGVGMKPKAEADITSARRDRQRGNRGDFLMLTSPMANDGRLTAWVPATPQHRRHQDAALIQEHDMSVQRPGFFLARGQSSLIHCAMRDSSRSTATLAGR